MYHGTSNLLLPGTPKQTTLLERHPRTPVSQSHMKYMLAKMLCVSTLRKFPVDGIVHPAQKFLKAT